MYFLTTIRHRLNSTSFDKKVIPLLLSTLRSIGGQTNPNYGIVVVANEKIDFSSLPNDLQNKIDLVVVDFPPPSTHRSAETGLDAFYLDAGTKRVRGILEIFKKGTPFTPYLMFVDADDFVSSKIVDFVETSRKKNGKGWFLERGYMRDSKQNTSDEKWVPLNTFHQICGTCAIVNINLLKSHLAFVKDESYEGIISSFASIRKDKLGSEFGAHRGWARLFQLEPLPFFGAVYNINTGENHSGSKFIQNDPRISQEMKNDFLGVRESSKQSKILPVWGILLICFGIFVVIGTVVFLVLRNQRKKTN